MKIASKETDTQRENGGPHTFDEYGPPWFGAEKKTNKNQQKIGEKTGENGAGGGWAMNYNGGKENRFVTTFCFGEE